MSNNINLIKSQQTILKDLGLYQGKIDGSWCRKSQSAMAGFQHHEQFRGLKARKNNAFFAPFEKLPRGWSWTPEGTITLEGAEVEPEPVQPKGKSQAELDAEAAETARLAQERREEQERLEAEEKARKEKEEKEAQEAKELEDLLAAEEAEKQAAAKQEAPAEQTQEQTEAPA